MIISPPLLKTQGATQSDDDWIDGLMPVQSTSDEFPVLDTLAWHGGYHLHHTDDTPLGNALRAIADGVVVYSRPSSGPSEVEPIGYQGKTDDGCIVIQHTTEIGEGVEVTYYSIYMHLKKSAALEASTLAGKKVYRKQEIGAVGSAKGQNMIHMEIICDQANLVKLTGRSTTKLDMTNDGRSTVVYGDIHFYLKSGTKFYATDNTSSAVSYTSNEDLFVVLRFYKGHAHLTTRRETSVGSGVYEMVGDTLQAIYKSPNNSVNKPLLPNNTPNPHYDANNNDGYEYCLYEIAQKLSSSTIAHSTVYEVLRFGRVLDTESGDISHIKHLHKVNFPGGVGYVDLNADGVKKFSDGDFPHWMGWSLIDDDPTEDSQCNSPTITKWLDTNVDGKNNHAELTTALGDVETLKRLSKTICNFPTEWDKTQIDAQYGWLKTVSDANPDPLTEENYAKFKAHVTALSFWDVMQAPAGGSALPPKKHWHFHPREFIKHFRKCGWLSLNELKQTVPSHAMRKNHGTFLWEEIHLSTSNTSVIVSQRVFLNRMMRKYLIQDSWRMASFLGNSIQESQWFSKLYENNSGQRYYPWDGRGFLQLTWGTNYFKYFKYRGRSISEAISNAMDTAEQTVIDTRSNQAYMNLEQTLPQNIKNWRKAVGANGAEIPDSIDAADSAGFYWAKLSMSKYADIPHVLERVALQTNGGQKTYYRSQSFWKASASVNLPGAVSHTNYSGINGFDARCCVYGVAVSVLGESLLPDNNGNLTISYPESFTRR